MTNNKQHAIKVGILGVIVLVMGVISATGHADVPQPTAQDYANLEDIKNNQKVLEETREAHERFMQAKAWNEAEVSEIGKNGWQVDWETMKLVPFRFPPTI